MYDQGNLNFTIMTKLNNKNVNLLIIDSMANMLQSRALSTVHPDIYYDMASSILASLKVNLFWFEQKLSESFSYLMNPFNTAILLIAPNFCGPLVTGLTGFFSTYMYMYMTV